jgi:glycosyltransferase involved in cell wall biosynthesis
LKITHLADCDVAGGAARAAYRLHTGLCGIGQESRMLVHSRQSADPQVICFQPPKRPFIRLRRGIKKRYLARAQAGFVRARGASLFSDDRSANNADVLGQLPPSDILNLHWVAGFFDYREFFRKLPARLPVVWTLHDMNPFTGGCHFDGGCGKFTERCGACPQLGSNDPADLSAQVWKRKREAFSSLKSTESVHLVTPSRWLQGEVSKSTLMSKSLCTVIPNALDTEQFQPREQGAARKLLGIPADSAVILFLADWAGEKRKGFDLLVEALKPFRNDPRVYLLAAGRELPAHDLGPQLVTTGYLTGEKQLSWVYSAADVFVLPSLQDNLPNTALEALSCGVPVVGFDVGGIPEIVREGETGLLVPAKDVAGLRAAITAVLENKDARVRMSEAGRRYAIANYGLEIQARRYLELYTELLARAK